MNYIRSYMLAAVAFGLFLGQHTHARNIEYDTLIKFESVAFPGRFLWTHPHCREIKDSAGKVMYGDPSDPLKAAFEILVGGDGRNVSTDNFMKIKAKGAPNKKGPINYGDEVEVWSMSTASSYGWPQYNDVLLQPRKWWVNLSSRHAPGLPQIYEILISPAQEPHVQDGQQLFAFVSLSGKTGPVDEGDEVYLVSKAPTASKDKRVWVHPQSRWGGSYWEVLVYDQWGVQRNNDRSLTNGKLKVHLINRDALRNDVEKKIYDAIQNPPADAQPGGKSFTHLPANEILRWHENWKIAEPGKGWVKFKARGMNDLDVAFSTLPQDILINHPALGADYRFVVGGWDNIQSVIRKSSGGAWVKDAQGSIELALSNIKKGGNPQAIVTGGKPGSGEQWEDYWFKVDNGTLSWGKGAVVGQNEMMRYVDPAPLGFVQYVSLGGYYNARVEFKDITFSAIEAAPKVINLPADFEAEEGKVKRITVGSRNGELEVWGIAFDGSLWRYDTYSMAPNPWVKQELKYSSGDLLAGLEDVSVSSDGILVGLNVAGKAIKYNFTTKTWDLIPAGSGNEDLDFEFISVGNKDTMWAVDVDMHDIYQWTPDKGWVVRADGIGAYVAAGVDGTVVGLNTAGKAFMFEGGRWIDMPGVILERVAVGDKNNIIGSTGKDNALWQWKNGKWEPMIGKDGKPASGLDVIAVNAAAGAIFGADEDGDVYHKGEAGVTVTAPAPAVVTAEIKKIEAALAAPKVSTVVLADLLPLAVSIAPDVTPAEAKAIAEKKASPAVIEKVKKKMQKALTTAEGKKKLKKAVKKKTTKAAKAVKKKKKQTRKEAKKAGKIKKKAIKKKTTGKGKALKKAAKAKKTAKKASKIKKKATKKLKKKASKKKKGAKKSAKKPKAKKSKSKKSAKKSKSKKKSAKKSKK